MVPTAASTPAIVVRGLTKRFGPRVAFEGLTFEVGAGEVFGFLGPNGAGKTTTVRVLGSLLRPTAGTAEVAGVSLDADHGSELRSRIAVMTENPGLYLKLTVHENLEYFAGLFGIPRPLVDARIRACLEAVDIGQREHELAGQLSKGLRQRVSLARTLLSEPKVLFLDEPTSGLDPVATREVRDLIESLRQHGVTVFLTTHRLEEAERLCDRVAILNTTLRIVGRPQELRDRVFSSALRVRTARPVKDSAALFGSVPGVSGWREEDGSYVVSVVDPEAVAPAVARALVGAGVDVVELGQVRRSLEDVYLELVRDDVEARS
jgi:ABC-2 type transport system ATP-binding protein